METPGVTNVIPQSAPHPEYGRWIAAHSGRFMAGGWLWYVGGIIVAAGFSGVVHVASGGDLSEGMGAMIGFPIGGALLLVAVARWRQRLDVYERGAVWRRMWGAKSIRFADVQNARILTTHSNTGAATEVELCLNDGRSVVLPNSLADVTQVANLALAAARSSAANDMTAQIVATLRAGQRVNFGNVLLDPLGLSWRGQSLAWSQISSAQIQFGDLIIEGFAAQPVRWQLGLGEVPSVDTLQGVLRAARGTG